MIPSIEVSTPMRTLFTVNSPRQWRDFIERRPDQKGGSPSELVLTETLLRDARRVNLVVNSIFYRSDEREYWQVAETSGD